MSAASALWRLRDKYSCSPPYPGRHFYTCRLFWARRKEKPGQVPGREFRPLRPLKFLI